MFNNRLNTRIIIQNEKNMLFSKYLIKKKKRRYFSDFEIKQRKAFEKVAQAVSGKIM